MSFYRAAELGRSYAATIRSQPHDSAVNAAVALIQADAIEKFARVLEQNGNDDTTSPGVVIIQEPVP